MLPSITIGPLPTYYLAMLLGIIAGWLLFLADDLSDCSGSKLLRAFLSTISYIIIVAFCIQGANYFHYLFDNIPDRVRSTLTLWDILLTPPFRTTKVLYGAIFFYPLGVLLAGFFRQNMCWRVTLNQKCFALFSILGFVRLGCFLNGCCYGIRSDLFGVCFPMGSSASLEHFRRGYTHGFVVPPSLPVIPTQLISSVFLFGLAIYAWRNFRKNRSSSTYATAVLNYAVFRFLIEFIRDDLDRAYWWIFSTSQWISLFIFVCFALLATFKKKAARQE
ncbi:MAG: prolipoprotein diacylglyceryl transferase family protein [Pseudomonadota bacterium]